MAGMELALDEVLQSGSCAAVAQGTRRARARSVRVQPMRATTTTKDYCLFDGHGKRLGTIAAAHIRPVLGKNAPALYLQIDPSLPPPRSMHRAGTSGRGK